MAIPLSRNIAQPGLQWRKGLLGAKPAWTKSPSIDTIKKLVIKHMHLGGEDAFTVKFFTEGAFNKLYDITCNQGNFVFRVTLPVAPNVKTLSEIATLAFVRENTTIPVPKVIAFDADLTNELGFEWILMEHMGGRPLREKWHDLSWLQKGLIVQEVADFIAQLARIKLPCTGSIYLPDPSKARYFQVGEAVQTPFFMEDHVQLDIPRGSFSNSHALVTAHMNHLQHDITTLLISHDEDEQEDAEEMQEICIQLAPIIPQLFPPSTISEPTNLFHPDLSANNILINDRGNLVGIVDWESVIAAPSWLSYQLPEFLEGPSRNILNCPEPVPSDDPEAVVNYQEQILDYEKAQLRRFFLEEMARIEPSWTQVFKQESTRRDVLVAIDLVGMCMRPRLVRGWIGAVAEGREPRVSLTDALRKED